MSNIKGSFKTYSNIMSVEYFRNFVRQVAIITQRRKWSDISFIRIFNYIEIYSELVVKS